MKLGVWVAVMILAVTIAAGTHIGTHIDELVKLNALKKDGAISKDEFEEMKALVLEATRKLACTSSTAPPVANPRRRGRRICVVQGRERSCRTGPECGRLNRPQKS